jgi:hypothetical protein
MRAPEPTPTTVWSDRSAIPEPSSPCRGGPSAERENTGDETAPAADVETTLGPRRDALAVT